MCNTGRVNDPNNMGIGVTHYVSIEDYLSEVTQEMRRMRRFVSDSALYSTWMLTIVLLMVAFVSQPAMIWALLGLVVVLLVIYNGTEWIHDGWGRFLTNFFFASRVPRVNYIRDTDYYITVSGSSIEARIPEYTVSGEIKNLHLGAHVFLPISVSDAQCMEILVDTLRRIHQSAVDLRGNTAQNGTPTG